MQSHPNLEFFAERLCWRAELTIDDIAAVSALPHTRRHLNANTFLIREGQPPRPACSLIIDGVAFRHKLTAEGARQIVSIQLPGDLLDLQHLFLNIADHSVQALTEIEIADIDRTALQKIVLERPAVGTALWVDGLVDSSIFREWVLNVGRRSARARIAHILCEIAIRMRAAGLIEDVKFHLPVTQEQLGDATGLTSVHVNRTIKMLVKEGLIDHGGRWIAIKDWEGIRRVGDFNPLYLHLDQVAPQFNGSLNSIFEPSALTERPRSSSNRTTSPPL
jgi:CRP-like cAMP-binding protein